MELLHQSHIQSFEHISNIGGKEFQLFYMEPLSVLYPVNTLGENMYVAKNLTYWEAVHEFSIHGKGVAALSNRSLVDDAYRMIANESSVRDLMFITVNGWQTLLPVIQSLSEMNEATIREYSKNGEIVAYVDIALCVSMLLAIGMFQKRMLTHLADRVDFKLLTCEIAFGMSHKTRRKLRSRYRSLWRKLNVGDAHNA